MEAKMSNIQIGDRIRTLREMNNYTREELAEKVDISTKFLYEIEMGKKVIMVVLFVLLKVVGILLEMLMIHY